MLRHQCMLGKPSRGTASVEFTLTLSAGNAHEPLSFSSNNLFQRCVTDNRHFMFEKCCCRASETCYLITVMKFLFSEIMMQVKNTNASERVCYTCAWSTFMSFTKQSVVLLPVRFEVRVTRVTCVPAWRVTCKACYLHGVLQSVIL
jgi:hypothetical protein